MPVHRACPICRENDQYRIPVSQRDKQGLTPVICRSCGLVFINPMYTYQEDLAESPSARQMHRPVRWPQPIESAYRRELSKSRLCMEILGREIAPGDDVLEVGMGDGSLLKLINDCGARSVGNDIDPEGCRFVERTFGIPAIVGSFEEADFGSRRFDMIVSSHVIEHMFEPVEVLVRMRGLLRPGGHVFLETPNILRPKVGPRRVFSRPHKYYFSPRTLACALHKAGFCVTAVRAFHRFAFQVLAKIASPEELAEAPAGDRWEDVLASIRRHAVVYHTSLQFLWRKTPLVKAKMIYKIHRDMEGDSLRQWLRKAA